MKCKMAISKTQIDRLGDRLKEGRHTDDDLRLLDEYRRTFGEACDIVVRKIRDLGESPTARLAKSTLSIVEKLRRESVRLSQMQDIGGCRVIVADILKQNQFVAALGGAFPDAIVIDRRENPSYGYRAIHVIAQAAGKPIEIQVRSALQHLWAELSEKASDVIDPAIKYGGGPGTWQDLLLVCSQAVAVHEGAEKRLRVACDLSECGMQGELEQLRGEVAYMGSEIIRLMHAGLSGLDDMKRQGQ
jgi:putative GTP pyrophosphokinase